MLCAKLNANVPTKAMMVLHTALHTRQPSLLAPFPTQKSKDPKSTLAVVIAEPCDLPCDHGHWTRLLMIGSLSAIAVFAAA